VTIVALGKKLLTNVNVCVCVCVCSWLSCSAFKSHLSCAVLYCHLGPVCLYHILPRYLIQACLKKVIDHKMYVVIVCTAFV
jgi:hypothetical protein